MARATEEIMIIIILFALCRRLDFTFNLDIPSTWNTFSKVISTDGLKILSVKVAFAYDFKLADTEH